MIKGISIKDLFLRNEKIICGLLVYKVNDKMAEKT
jgi:hypothetical protein